MNNSFNFQIITTPTNHDYGLSGGQERGERVMEQTLQDYQDYLAVHKRKEYTRRYYYDTIHKLLTDTKKTISTLTKKDINQWIAIQNQKNLAHNTIQNYIIRINLFLQWLNRKEWNLKRIGWKDTNRTILTLQEIIKIRNTAQKISPEHHLIILFITDLAARPSEICNAKYSNITGNKIYFNDSKTGNTYGFITLDFQQALYNYQKIRPIPKPEYKDYILINTNGNKFCPKSQHIRTILRQVTKKIGLPHSITPYDLRSSMGTQEFNMYVNPKVIQRKFRHRNLNTTMKYNHVDDQMAEDYANNGLIFNNHSLFPPSDKKTGINNYLYNNIYPQDLNNTDENDNNSFSFSLSFEQQHGEFQNGNNENTFSFSFFAFPLIQKTLFETPHPMGMGKNQDDFFHKNLSSQSSSSPFSPSNYKDGTELVFYKVVHPIATSYYCEDSSNHPCTYKHTLVDDGLKKENNYRYCRHFNSKLSSFSSKTLIKNDYSPAFFFLASGSPNEPSSTTSLNQQEMITI